MFSQQAAAQQEMHRGGNGPYLSQESFGTPSDSNSVHLH